MKSRAPRTIIDKIWDAHTIVQRDDGDCLLWVDRHFVHEGSHHGFAYTKARGAQVARPDLTFGMADHYVPTRTGAVQPDDTRRMIRQLQENAAQHGITCFGEGHARQGIAHVVAPELGITLPGLLIVCGDSHTSTHGALGAYAFGIGASEVAHVLMTQTIWQSRPKRMRLRIDGTLAPGLSAKDMALSIISRIGTGYAQGCAIEYAGSAVRGLSVEGRLTLCNMSIESGSRLGLIAPDETTFAWLRGRSYAPQGDAFDAAVADWRQLASDDEAVFDREIVLDAKDIAPTATWGTSPEHAAAITAHIPDPASEADPTKAEALRDALAYMDLKPGMALTDIPIDRVFIGSCTNSRIEDLRAAAAVLAGRHAIVPGLVSPGSGTVKRQAEEEGLDRIFTAAGLEWAGPGCSMCVGMNGDVVPAGERCASTTNRNFKGRQGKGSRTHLMSPAMVAAAAVTGHLTDPRLLTEGRQP
ncbi:MAG: 3-isopropylmalate dehydratase large subunit [Rhizobiales bacterium 62-17]|nr:3-isopropylmalate dehydratase large subunit [Hyphomicrobiales bacterium]OJY05636.1 MAG: 3-isopropylmalate dehydratase large subunit [Rhizobiales bacterium 62-17]